MQNLFVDTVAYPNCRLWEILAKYIGKKRCDIVLYENRLTIYLLNITCCHLSCRPLPC